MNFFLFNHIADGEDYIIADELVFQALSWEHNPSFDTVALFAFLFSYAGRWKGAKKEQRRPALWANAYVTQRVSATANQNDAALSADSIEEFLRNDRRYQAQTTRKLATNLSYLLRIGRVGRFREKIVTRWWVDCLFLALDRLIEDARLDGRNRENSALEPILARSSFNALTGDSTLEKELATKHLIRLYLKIGGRKRLFDDFVTEKTIEQVPGASVVRPNNPLPRGAIHPTNPRILKSIPPLCAELAKSAGFEVISPNEMDELNLGDFTRYRTSAALVSLDERKIAPTMTIEELLKITRGE
ncbi:hypothetical protein [Ruegeria arenilitoris]|uniref:hypothetical protein n=1 Tax=Ruegeria arenilitoris TaxID=1173585 RepID=UPI0014819FEE|nr:hypothetical protein [Ruegeria arenilitoris]